MYSGVCRDALPVTLFSKHRKFYYKLKKWLGDGQGICALLGPRKVGKTFALSQLCNECEDAVYVDFKQHAAEDEDDLLDYVEECVEQGGIVILDEITYLHHADVWLSRLANLVVGTQAKVIVTGSQPVAIRQWIAVSYGSNAEVVETSFIDFEEFLVLRGKMQYNGEYVPTTADYYDYVTRSAEVLGITSDEEYLRGCLTETVVSRENAARRVEGVALTNEDEEVLLSLMYLILIKLHYEWREQSFYKWDAAVNSICSAYNGDLKRSEVKQGVGDAIADRLRPIRKLTEEKLEIYLRFLLQCDLITYVEDGENAELFNGKNICFKHPIFYFNLIEALTGSGSEFVNGAILGSILECNVRGMWSTITGSSTMQVWRMRDDRGYVVGEVDIYDEWRKVGIEITINDKSRDEVMLSRLPSDFKKILFTRTKKWYKGNDFAEPYPELCLRLSKMI